MEGKSRIASVEDKMNIQTQDARHPVAALLKQISNEWREISSQETEIAMMFVRISEIIRERVELALAPFALSRTGFEVLTVLRSMPRNQSTTPTELARTVLLTSGGMTKVLGTLEKSRLVRREDSVEDRRSKTIQLTAKGRRLIEAAMKEVVKVDVDLFTTELATSHTVHATLRSLLNEIEGQASEKQDK